VFVQQFKLKKTFLGIPSEIYTYGTQFVLIIFGIGFCVFVSAELWIPILYDLRVVSIYEYFFLRFGSKFPRRLMSIIFVLNVLLTYQKIKKKFSSEIKEMVFSFDPFFWSVFINNMLDWKC